MAWARKCSRGLAVLMGISVDLRRAQATAVPTALSRRQGARSAARGAAGRAASRATVPGVGRGYANPGRRLPLALAALLALRVHDVLQDVRRRRLHEMIREPRVARPAHDVGAREAGERDEPDPRNG